MVEEAVGTPFEGADVGRRAATQACCILWGTACQIANLKWGRPGELVLEGDEPLSQSQGSLAPLCERYDLIDELDRQVEIAADTTMGYFDGGVDRLENASQAQMLTLLECGLLMQVNKIL